MKQLRKCCNNKGTGADLNGGCKFLGDLIVIVHFSALLAAVKSFFLQHSLNLAGVAAAPWKVMIVKTEKSKYNVYFFKALVVLDVPKMWEQQQLSSQMSVLTEYTISGLGTPAFSINSAADFNTFFITLLRDSVRRDARGELGGNYADRRVHLHLGFPHLNFPVSEQFKPHAFLSDMWERMPRPVPRPASSPRAPTPPATPPQRLRQRQRAQEQEGEEQEVPVVVGSLAEAFSKLRPFVVELPPQGGAA